MTSHTGRTALITGAARGIGAVIARRLAADGAAVALLDMSPAAEDVAAEIRAAGGRASAHMVDLADAEAITRGVDEARAALGPVNILVNNAGITNNIAPLSRMKADAWQREMAVNLTAPMLLIQQVIGDMVSGRWGRIVNVSSLGASGGLHNQVGYAASKSGLLGLTKTVTLEHARHGVTCNAILPGLIGTEMVRKMPQEIIDASLRATPAERLGEMTEIAALVAFLASDEAGYINGAEIPVDGGTRLNATALGSRKEASARSGAAS